MIVLPVACESNHDAYLQCCASWILPAVHTPHIICSKYRIAANAAAGVKAMGEHPSGRRETVATLHSVPS